MKNIIERIVGGGAKIARYLPKAVSTRLAVAALAALAAGGAWADATANNPVTGVSESYTYKYVGSESDSTWEAVANWRNADDTAYSVASGFAPNLSNSNVWTPLLFDGSSFASGASKSVSATTIEGYTLNLGIFNGAQVTIETLSKWQGGCKVRVDDNSSSLTISALGSKSYEGAVDYYVAGANGVTYSSAFNKGGNTHNYYLTGAGSVSYQAIISAGTHVIKQADVALDGGTKARKSKTLVSFTSSSISFSADATIYVKDSGGTTKRTITATQITSSTPTITTDYPVGTCELVQESDGIKLYYIDGDYDTDFVAYIGDDPTANKYHTIVEAAAAIAEDNTLVKLTLLSSTEESFVVPSVGFVFDTNGKTVTGTISGASGVGLTEVNGVYTGIANTAATWTGAAGDNLWENAQNWSTKSVPTSATTVTFADDATVAMNASETTIYGLVVNQGKFFTLYRSGNSTGDQNSLLVTLKVGAGYVTGGGTVKLICAGISKTVGNFTINANIEFLNNGTYYSFLEETASGTFTINGTVTGTGYLNIKTSTTFNGDVTIPQDSLVKVYRWTYELGNGARLFGAGTLKFDTVEPSATMKTALQNKDRWKGVCEIYNKALTNINAANYGNVNSTVRYNKVTGYSAYWTNNTGEVGNVKCIDIGSEGLAFDNSFGSNNFGYTFAGALTGTGTITFGTSYGGSGTYTFTGDASAFAGTISFGSLAADRKAAVIFNSTGAAAPTTGKGQIGIAAGTTVGLKEFTGTIVGSGTVKWTTLDPSSSVRPTFDPSWTGTVVLPFKQGSMTVNLAWWGVTGSRIKVMGFQGSSSGNSVKIGADAVAATVELAGDVQLQHGDDDTTYNIAALTGSGDFNTTLTGTPTSTENMRLTYSFAKLTDYTGTISTVTPDAGAGKTWWTKVAIGTVNVSSLDLTSSAPVVKLGGTRDLVSIPALTVNDVATSHELYQAADGNLYVKVASVTVGDAITYYPTLQAAADAAMAAGGDAITFTRIDSEAATSLPGWAYDADAGTFTRSGYARNTTTGVEYASLGAAISASSSGDTIQLLYDNSETALDTSGKDFVFDENGYAFTGTWTGSGRIVLSTKPSSTTWGANRFVSTAANEGEPVWTGTVAVDWGTVAERDNSALYSGNVYSLMTAFGTANSTVEIGENSKTVGNCYFGNTPSPKLRVSGCLYINDGAANTPQTIANVTGSGVLVFGDKANTVNYKITTLQDWTGTLTISSAKITIGTVADTVTGDVVIDYTNSAWTEKLSQYCGTNSRLIVRNLTGYLSDGNNSSNTGKIDAQALEIGNVTIKDAWYLSSPNWTDGKTVKFAKMHLTGKLKMGKDGGTEWLGDAQRGCYMVDSLSVGEDGEIEVANQFAFRINAVEADGATPGQLVVPVTLSNAGDAKAVGELFGPDGNLLTAANPIPVTVNGTANGCQLVYATINTVSGLYKAVASYNTSYYATMTEAIAAAVKDSHTYENVTILDATAECPDEYYIDSGTLKKKPAAVCKAGTLTYYTTIEKAMDAANMAAYIGGGYDYVIFFENAAVTQILDGMKIKQVAGVTVTVATSSAEFTSTPGAADAEGIVTYALANAPTAYTWTDAYFAPDPQTSEPVEDHHWSSEGNWSFGSGTTATRYPQSGDTVSFSSASTVTLDANAACASMTIAGCAVSISADSAKTLTAGTISLTAAESSISVTDVTLSPVPTTTVADSYVKATTSGSTTTYTVATQPTVSDVAFEYGADYATATVTATVSDAAPSYKLTVGGTEYTGVVSGSKVTFSNVATGRTAAYDDVSYEIAATSGSTAVPLVGDTSGSAEISDTKTWFSHNSSGLTGGAWSNAVDLGEGPATVEDNTFTATAESTSSRVVLEFNVCFSATNDADVDGTAQAAIKLGEVDGATTFMVLTNANEWAAISNAALTPDVSEPYKVVLTIDYGSNTYKVDVGGCSLTNASGSASFPLAANKKSVQSIDFAGSGVLTSMKGDQVEGYMVVDNNGARYPTIAAAIAAYNANPTIGPLKVLHAGTAPSGWSIVSEGGIDILKKLAKGFFFMAY